MSNEYEGLVVHPVDISCPISSVNFICIYSNPSSKKRGKIAYVDKEFATKLLPCCHELYTNLGVQTIYDGGFYNPRASRLSDKPSMHARGKAGDAFAFWVKHLGKKLTVKDHWQAKPITEEAKVLAQILATLRRHFTVIGPDAKSLASRKLHRDHFHIECK